MTNDAAYLKIIDDLQQALSKTIVEIEDLKAEIKLLLEVVASGTAEPIATQDKKMDDIFEGKVKP